LNAERSPLAQVEVLGTGSAAVKKDNFRTSNHLHETAAEAMPVSHALPPKMYKEVLSLPDAAQWLQAIEEEAAACLAFNVWEACELPATSSSIAIKVVGSKLVWWQAVIDSNRG
jgi:hypothetical protein